MNERVENGARDDWEEHWRDYAHAAAHNPAQEYRRRLVLDAIAEHPPVRRVLDIGAGTGDLAADVHRSFPTAQILGIDVSGSGLAAAREKVPEAVFLQRDLLEEQPETDAHRGWATHAACSEVLEHVSEPERLLRQASGYLSPGCKLVVTVPGGPMSAFDRYIGHRRHYTPDDVRRLLVDAGFVVERASGAGFPFFNLYRLVVIARGKRLAAEASNRTPSVLARIVMAVFRVLFRLNLAGTPWGWQTVAVARLPD
jgi:SAM-dependent methyltransferase